MFQPTHDECDEIAREIINVVLYPGAMVRLSNGTEITARVNANTGRVSITFTRRYEDTSGNKVTAIDTLSSTHGRAMIRDMVRETGFWYTSIRPDHHPARVYPFGRLDPDDDQRR